MKTGFYVSSLFQIKPCTTGLRAPPSPLISGLNPLNPLGSHSSAAVVKLYMCAQGNPRKITPRVASAMQDRSFVKHR
jgi:hypothetical protein